MQRFAQLVRPDDREHQDAEERHHRDEVLQEAQRVPPADERNVEVVVYELAERLQIDELVTEDGNRFCSGGAQASPLAR